MRDILYVLLLVASGGKNFFRIEGRVFLECIRITVEFFLVTYELCPEI